MLISSDPAHDATDVAINANIILTFNTAVSAPDTAFGLNCDGNDIPFTQAPAAGADATTHSPIPTITCLTAQIALTITAAASLPAAHPQRYYPHHLCLYHHTYVRQL